MLSNIGTFSVMYDGRSQPISDYYLRISFHNFTGYKHFTDGKKRSLNDTLPTLHQFLFDADFFSNNSTKVPGSYISVWLQLCYFTFFVIQEVDGEKFNILLDQFKALTEVGNISFTRDDFKAFFTECSDCMRNHLDAVRATVTTDEWPLFKNGLSTIICINLLKQVPDSYKSDRENQMTLSLLRRISERNQMEDIANTVVKRLDSLNLSIMELYWTELLAERVEITADEILRDTFDQPTDSSLIYSILFDDWSQTLTIRRITTDQLIVQLITWEDQGLRVGEITKWKNYSNGERQAACRIWNHICQIADKKFVFDELIKIEDDEMRAKLRTRDEITLCLTTYCDKANDRDTYLQNLDDMDYQLENQIVRSISLPERIRHLVPFVTRLSAFSESTVWLKFYREQRQSSMVTSNNKSDNSMDYDETCASLLTQADKIFDQFIAELNSICNGWKESSISRLTQLFPDLNYIDDDLKTIEPLLLNTMTVPVLKKMLDYWKSHKRIYHICQGCVELMAHLQIPIDSTILPLTMMLKINDKTSGETFYKVYQDFSELYFKRYSSKVLSIIAHYSLSDELLKFLHSITTTDASNLLEAVNDWDESLVNTKTVLDFVMIKTFLDQIYARIESIRKQQSSILEFEQIVNCFEYVLNDNDFRNILPSFESSSMSLCSIQRVHLDLTDRKQSKRQRILEIMKTASFTIVNQSVKSPDTVGHQFDIDIDAQSMAYEDLRELRDRARLIEYSNDKTKNDSEEELVNLHLFITIVDLIEVILERLTLLHISGQPYVSNPYEPMREFRCTAKDYEALSNFSSKLENLLNRWESHLCMLYEQYLDLTYFSFHQIWLIEHFLKDASSRCKNDAAYHLLKFIGIEPKSILVHGSTDKTENIYQRLVTVGQILNAQRTHENQATTCPKMLSKHVILIETSEEGVMRAILSFFHLLNIQARANQLFYCTENTSWMEIRAFMYRCFYSQTLQLLIRPQLLTSLIQNRLVQLLRQLIKHRPEQQFQLGIITTVSAIHVQLINGLKTFDIVHTYHDQDMLDLSDLRCVVKQYISNNIILVKSRIAGLGKSTFIRDAILRMNKMYIKFPINGDIRVDKLAQRLSSYGTLLVPPKAAIHLDIGTINNDHQLNELLYCLLLFRNFRLGHVAVHIPVDIPIYIELDASLNMNSLYQKIVIFRYLNTKNIDSMNWNELKPDNLTGIQWVLSYLQSIENRTINEADINETTIQSLGVDTGWHLLQQYVLRGKNTEFVSWTKVSIFVAVYSSLFAKFSRCGHFLVNSVRWLKAPQLRMDILLSLTNSSDQFTSLSVETVRKNQRAVNDSGSVDFSEAIIRWDKSQAFTLVFTATDDPIFVYKTAENVPKSLIAVLDSPTRSCLVNNKVKQSSRQESRSTLLPDYTKLTHVQLFTKLASLSKKYFNKSICLRCFSQYGYIDKQCQKCMTNDALVRPLSSKDDDIARFQEMIANRFQDEYVLTPDNYIKMLLIYSRVQSGLPVLIMGETGPIILSTKRID
ncbi:unnamed protein product [Adineta steineri]|uniref:Uncharacterized protein n=1 Tax=Adineta steineri TaxID=433720 RepID=A0A813YHH3_9BILA|nr:unnamed protein product [Adineta steineri]CAF1405405.1 unnamed protein product [Adineta steineri]